MYFISPPTITQVKIHSALSMSLFSRESQTFDFLMWRLFADVNDPPEGQKSVTRASRETERESATTSCVFLLALLLNLCARTNKVHAYDKICARGLIKYAR